MRTSLAIGLGVISFGLGIVATKWVDGEGAAADDATEKSARERRSLGKGGFDKTLAGGKSGVGAPKNGAVPSTESLIALLDVWDQGVSLSRLQPLLNDLDPEGFQQLLLNLERDAVEPEREFALSVVGKFFAREHPFAAFELAADPKMRRLLDFAPPIVGMIREDPVAALAAVDGLEDRRLSEKALNQLVISMSNLNPELLGDWIESEPSMKDYFAGGGGYKSLLRGMAAKSPAKAASFAGKLEGRARDYAIRGLAEIWVQSDPKAAVGWADSLEGRERDTAMRWMMGELVVRDADAAFKILEGDKNRMALISPMMRGLAERSPERAIELVQSLEDPKEVRHAMRYVSGHSLTKDGVDTLLGIIEELPENERKDAGKDLLSSWIRLDEQAAMDWVEATEDPLERDGYVKEVLEDLDGFEAVELVKRFPTSVDVSDWRLYSAFSSAASEDLEKAREAAASLPDGQVRLQAMGAVISSWVSDEPQAAAEYVLDRYESGPELREMLNTVSSRWARRDPEEAMAWVSGLNVSNRVAASDSLISSLVSNGKADLARETLAGLIVEHPAEASKAGRLERAIYSVMENVGYHDPQEGISIINQLATENAQSHAVSALVNSWADSQPDEALDWVRELPLGMVRDVAAKEVAQNMATRDGAAAFEMAVSIENEGLRASSLGWAVVSWLRQDPEAARAAIEAADLSEQERERLLDRSE